MAHTTTADDGDTVDAQYTNIEDDAREVAQRVARKGIQRIEDVSGVHSRKADALRDAGYPSVAAVAYADQTDLADVNGIDAVLAARMKADVGHAGGAF